MAVKQRTTHKIIFDSPNLQVGILGLVVSLSKNGAAATTKDEERRRTHDPSATQECLDHQHLHLVQDLRDKFSTIF